MSVINRLSLIALVVAAFVLGGCARTAGPPQAYAPAPEGPYLLDSGDRLRIVVFGQESLTSSYTVDGGGAVSMPLVGAVRARGRSIRDLETAIAQELGKSYLRNPNVTVEIETYRPFFILGEVRNPGQYPYVAGMTVETAVAIAGGYTPRAARSGIEITRQLQGRVVHSRVQPIQPVRPGDTINVQERFF